MYAADIRSFYASVTYHSNLDLFLDRSTTGREPVEHIRHPSVGISMAKESR